MERDLHLKRSPTVALLAACLCAVLARPAMGQESIPVQTLPEAPQKPSEEKDASAVQLEAVVVTGEKLGRKLSETASSTAIVRARDIEAQGDGKVQEAVSQAANVVRAQSDRQIAIRGVLQNGIAGDGETISVIVDGVALPQRAANFGGPLGVFDVEQIEVLRGAQSTTQGRNALAGAVIVKTRDPKQEWDGKARAERATLDGGSFALAGGGALIPGWLAGRVSHEQRYFRNDIVNTTRGEDDAGREVTETSRAKLLLTPPMWSAYRGLLTVSHADNEFGDNIHDSTRAERTETANERYSETYRGEVWSLQQGLELGERFRLDAITGYAPGRDYRFADFDRTERRAGSAIYDYTEANRSQELRVGYQGSEAKGVLGVYVARIAQYAYNATVEPIPAGGGAALLSGYQFSDTTTETRAVFGEMDWRFPGALTATFGARYQVEDNDRHQVSMLDFAANGGAAGLPVNVPIPDAGADLLSMAAPDSVPPDYDIRATTHFPVLLPKVGLGWQFAEQHRVALTYQEGYRSGGTSVSFFGGARSDFDPEFTRTLELSLRSAFPALRASLNANVFYTRWRDQQVTIGDATSFYTTTSNAGRSHLTGAELELNARPFRAALGGWLRGFEPFASLGYLDTAFDEFVNNGVDYRGNAFPYAPNFTGTLGAHYRRGGFFAYTATTYNGEYFGQASNVDTSRVPAKTLINARLGWQLRREDGDEGVRIAVYGRNLTDDLNLQDRFVVGTGANVRTAKRYGEPRLFGVAVEATF